MVDLDHMAVVGVPLYLLFTHPSQKIRMAGRGVNSPLKSIFPVPIWVALHPLPALPGREVFTMTVRRPQLKQFHLQKTNSFDTPELRASLVNRFSYVNCYECLYLLNGDFNVVRANTMVSGDQGYLSSMSKRYSHLNRYEPFCFLKGDFTVVRANTMAIGDQGYLSSLSKRYSRLNRYEPFCSLKGVFIVIKDTANIFFK